METIYLKFNKIWDIWANLFNLYSFLRQIVSEFIFYFFFRFFSVKKYECGQRNN